MLTFAAIVVCQRREIGIMPGLPLWGGLFRPPMGLGVQDRLPKGAFNPKHRHFHRLAFQRLGKCVRDIRNEQSKF